MVYISVNTSDTTILTIKKVSVIEAYLSKCGGEGQRKYRPKIQGQCMCLYQYSCEVKREGDGDG